MNCYAIANIISRIDFVALATAIMTIFTGCLVVCNIYLWRSTDKAANAAQKAAEALPTIERAYVFVNMNGAVSNLIKNICLFTVPINLINQGKTPAILKKIYAGIIITKITIDKLTKVQAEEFIEEIPFYSMENTDSDKREIRGAESWSNYIPIKVNFNDFSEFFNADNPSKLYCCGKVIYDDVMKNSHTTWFCWELRGVEGITDRIFWRTDNEELNDYT